MTTFTLGFTSSIYAACEIDGKLSPALASYDERVKKAFEDLRRNVTSSC